MTVMLTDIPSGSPGLYGNNSGYMLNGVWAEVNASLPDDPDPNITGNVLYFNQNNLARYVYRDGAVATAGIAARLWMPSIPASDAQRPAIMQFRDGSNDVKLALFVSPTGAIQVYRDILNVNGVGTLIGQTSGPVLVANAWRHIEVKAVRSTTVGTVEIRVEGIPVLTLTGVNTGAADYAQCALGINYSLLVIGSTTLYMKDIAFWNGNGSENNNFVGPCQVYYCPPNADVSSGWSRTSGASDYALIDESPPVDSGYIYAPTPPPAPSIMNVVPLPPDVVAIRSIMPVARVQKSDGGDGKLQISISPNGTDWDDGADSSVSTAFTYQYDISEVSPDTTAPWTPVEFSTLQYKLNRTV